MAVADAEGFRGFTFTNSVDLMKCSITVYKNTHSGNLGVSQIQRVKAIYFSETHNYFNSLSTGFFC